MLSMSLQWRLGSSSMCKSFAHEAGWFQRQYVSVLPTTRGQPAELNQTGCAGAGQRETNRSEDAARKLTAFRAARAYG